MVAWTVMYSGVQQRTEVAGAQGLLSSIFFFSTVKPVLSGRHLGMAYWPLNTVKVWQKWELLKKMKVVKERIIHPTFTCFYLILGQKKKVKDHLTPYTVRLFAL